MTDSTALTPSISSITKGPRQSNFELLRILAMLLVVMVHADFWALGRPEMSDFNAAPLNAFTRTFFEAVSIVCVNVFILISGWFGIKSSLKGFLNFIFQCAFFYFGLYAVMLLTGHAELSAKGIASCLCLVASTGWFIRAYVALYILAPVLNAFLEVCTKRQLGILLLCFYGFQTIWGCTGAAKFIDYGYSTLSFIGLYLLARYIRLYGSKLYKSGGVIYFGSVLLLTACYYFGKRFGIRIEPFDYINPFVITASCGLLIFFSQLRISTNKVINWVAKSSFAVYLVHANPNVAPTLFKPLMQKLYDGYDGIACLAIMLGAIVVIYIISILLDQPRKYLWNLISKRLK